MILKLEPQTLANEFSQLGIHPASEAIFLHKSEIVPLKILDIRTPLPILSNRKCWLVVEIVQFQPGV